LRESKISRRTRETEVSIRVNLDATGKADVQTGIDFLDHMISSLATHSLIDIDVDVKGDLKHHIAEDVAICLGQALRKALGDGKGIYRFGYAIVPMDYSLAFSAIDLATRPCSKIDLKLRGKRIEDMVCEDINHFLETLASSLKASLHLWIQDGVNDHHKAEAVFKALALSLRQAVAIDPRRREVPSSKGII
jgi:imidazoleglycerol-phosphate dehydratase